MWQRIQKQYPLVHPALNLLIQKYLQENPVEMLSLWRGTHTPLVLCPGSLYRASPYPTRLNCRGGWLFAPASLFWTFPSPRIAWKVVPLSGGSSQPVTDWAWGCGSPSPCYQGGQLCDAVCASELPKGSAKDRVPLSSHLYAASSPALTWCSHLLLSQEITSTRASDQSYCEENWSKTAF